MRALVGWTLALGILLGVAFAGIGSAAAIGGTGHLPALRRATPALGSPIMVEGKVLAQTATTLTIVTPETGSGCRPPMMCPQFLLAPVHYQVYIAGAKYFGPYIGGPRSGDEIVVYGTLLRAATSYGGSAPKTSFGQGLISAGGILIITPTTYGKPLPMGHALRSSGGQSVAAGAKTP